MAHGSGVVIIIVGQIRGRQDGDEILVGAACCTSLRRYTHVGTSCVGTSCMKSLQSQCKAGGPNQFMIEL